MCSFDRSNESIRSIEDSDRKGDGDGEEARPRKPINQTTSTTTLRSLIYVPNVFPSFVSRARSHTHTHTQETLTGGYCEDKTNKCVCVQWW